MPGIENYLNTPDVEWFRNRITGALICAAAAFLLLFGRLFYLQILEGEYYRELSEENRIQLKSLHSARGLIYDVNKVLLVENQPFFDLTIVHNNAGKIENTLETLSGLLDIPFSALEKEVASIRGKDRYRPVVIRENIGWEGMSRVEVHQYDLPGVDVKARPRRYSVYGKSAAHILGYLGEINSFELETMNVSKNGKDADYRMGDLIGKFGIEKTWEHFLRGKRRRQLVEVNAAGRVIDVLEEDPEQPGHNVYLTIDHRLQLKAEALLEGISGAVCAMDPKTGEILVLASAPSFNPNDFVGGISHKKWKIIRENPFSPMENKAIQGMYAPASTYKIVTAIASLEKKQVDQDTVFHCPGYLSYAGHIYRCWKRGGHGTMNIVRAIAQSCDVYFYQAGIATGVDGLAEYARMFGLGRKTGILLENEASGLVPTSAWKKNRYHVKWYPSETLSVAIGQGYNLATPIQMLVLVSAVANGGKVLVPKLISSIHTPDGKPLPNDVIYADHPHPLPGEVRQEIRVSRDTMQLVKEGLWEVVNHKGTARRARIPGIDVAGKTGTAQVVGRKKGAMRDKELPDHLKDHAWFVGYAPAQNPRIAAVALVENGEHGSGAGAPIVREIIELYLAKPATSRAREEKQ